MNIYALKGHKVRFLGKNGYDAELASAKKVLEVGKEYTVESTRVSSWCTNVILKEIGQKNNWDSGFNSVMFEDVKPQNEEDDKKHSDYKFWNNN